MTLFYYCSDNLSDEQKERIIDFRNYDDNGKWYVLLDEAHKGDKEDSKRQHIYSILARNGFLFNFSATFTDERDIATTVCDFNLARFTQAGYGKHLAILQQEFRAFRDQDDYTGEEKQKIVLKSLMLLAYVMKLAERLRTKQPKMYHRPLLLTLVNSVNTEDADLKRFFRELERAGKGEVADSVWQAAKKELLDELSQRPAPVFESDSVVSVQEDVLRGLKPKDMLKLVFNASSPGEIEVLVRPSNRQELAFKLKTSERPFARLRWLGGFVHRPSLVGLSGPCRTVRSWFLDCIGNEERGTRNQERGRGMAHTKTYWKLDGYRHLFEENGRPRRIMHEGVAANVQTYCYNRDAAQSDELHRRFWVGSIAELLQKVGV